MIRLIIFVIVAAVIWFGYTHLGQPANLDNVIQNGTNSIKQEKTINNVINRRQGMADEVNEAIGE